MPQLTRKHLAMKLRQNWLAMYPNGTTDSPSNMDDSLTCLNWLYNLDIMKLTTPEVHVDQCNMQVDPNAVLNVNSLVKQEVVDQHRYDRYNDVSPPSLSNGVQTVMNKIDYKNNSYVKPPYSYATLICMAMRETKHNKITLSGIYNWITENFMYYRNADPSWQNSIRHNLSLNKCFQKVARRKDEPGKGGFWRINSEYSDMFVNGIFKKRRGGSLPVSRDVIMPLAKRFRGNDAEVNAANAGVILHDAHRGRQQYSTENTPKAETIFQMGADSITDVLDISWNNVLMNQEIEVDGVKIKTEDIINGVDCVADPITSLSPPPSSDCSDDIGLDELLGTDFSSLENPLDIGCDDAIDLTVQGTGIRPPEWWNDSGANRDMFSGILLQQDTNSGMGTPTTQCSADHDDYMAHPWAEDRLELDQALAAFGTDFQSIFDIENMPHLAGNS